MTDPGWMLLTDAMRADHERGLARWALQREALSARQPTARWHHGATWGFQLPVPLLRLVQRFG